MDEVENEIKLKEGRRLESKEERKGSGISSGNSGKEGSGE